ncbi:hypothetical protein, partial [Luteolibacter pohnpeiensis]|uniref:hypothetical protein n=1 Tax=Luteolibacter pohnpeiensis TaxID=454153 RepID=UPI001F3D1DE2
MAKTNSPLSGVLEDLADEVARLLEGFAYPCGREITHQYGSSNSMSDWLSRLDTVYDSTSSF